ncbi:hydroxyatrazine ethylaminohydrolase, partial [Klebsiella pneumoniae]
PRGGRWKRICRWRCVRKPSTAIWRMSNGWSAAITTPGPSLCAGW